MQPKLDEKDLKILNINMFYEKNLPQTGAVLWIIKKILFLVKAGEWNLNLG